MISLIGLAIYAGYGVFGLACLLCATLAAYAAGLATEKHRWAAWVGILLSACLLLFFKVQHLAGLALAAPLGVSYFTLMLIAYNADVYRGRYPAERNFLRFAAYVCYLPHLFMGPIEGYDRLGPNLFENRRVSWDGISSGAARFLWGLFKKLVIAARAGVIISAISAEPETYRGAYALAAVIMYSVQLYSDFSGGIDMVLGLSRMLGITLSENFDAPFLSQSFQEFWRRWHMTLGGWLRAYIYIPLGGNRKGKARKLLNTLITFLVSGFWHGSQYLLWGLFNGIFVAMGDLCKTRWKALNRLGTGFAVSLLWCFFVWPDAATAVKMLLSMVTEFSLTGFLPGMAALGLTAGDWLVLAVSLLALGSYDCKRSWFREKFLGLAPGGRVALICTVAFLVLVFGMYGIGFNASEFIYSRF